MRGSTGRRFRPGWLFLALGVLGALALGATSAAPEAHSQHDASELAKKTQNPIADLIAVSFQNNFNFGTAAKDQTVWVLNVKPIVPIKLTEDWNLVIRTEVPIINQPSLFTGSDSAFGLGDINPDLFFSPAKSNKFIWGAGPAFTLPTATDSQLGSGKFSLGPAAIALLTHGPWVAGALVNNQWSVAGWGDRDVNQMLLQPFVNYNIRNGWYLTSVPVLTANWKAERGEKWTVPVGGGVGKLFLLGDILPLGDHALGKQAINTQVQAFYNVEKPTSGPEWQLRFQIQFLFPTPAKKE